MKVFSGSGSQSLTDRICEDLDVDRGKAMIGRFSDGEIRVQIGENIRGRDVFLVVSTATPVNDSLMELLILIDAARRASAERITAVLPYFGYARQDRKDKARVPITAKLVANLPEIISTNPAGQARILGRKVLPLTQELSGLRLQLRRGNGLEIRDRCAKLLEDTRGLLMEIRALV